MTQKYSQWKALAAITKASFMAIFKQPASLFFSFLFPLVFILIFGSFGKDTIPVNSIAFTPTSDTSNAFYDSMKTSPFIKISRIADTALLRENLELGRLTAILHIIKLPSLPSTRYLVKVHTTTASEGKFPLLFQVLQMASLQIASPNAEKRPFTLQPVVSEGRKYRQIDFVLPGQIGFSILFATLFGISFTFFNMREQLILKRFYATPVHKLVILFGIGTSRLFFQLINVALLVLFGYFFLHFTLLHGWLTFLEIMVFSVVMLVFLMGVGLIISSVVKTDTTIPLLINLFGFPQMLLSGTFFSITVFPKWLQELCVFLPLTQFNNAMRKISFDGLHLLDTWKEMGSLFIWTAITYFILSRLIKWE